MKKIILFLLLLLPFIVKGQQSYYNFNSYGYCWTRGMFSITLTIPYRDTINGTNSDSTRAGAILLRPADKRLYTWNGSSWIMYDADTSKFFKNGGNAFGANATIGNISNFALGLMTNGVEYVRLTNNGSLLIGSVGMGVASGGPYQLQVTGKEAIVNNHSYQSLLYFLDASGNVVANIDTNGTANLSALTITGLLSQGTNTDSILVIHNGLVKSILQSSLATQLQGYALTNSPSGTLNVDSTKVILNGGQNTGTLNISAKVNNITQSGIDFATNNRTNWHVNSTGNGNANRIQIYNSGNSGSGGINLKGGQRPYLWSWNGPFNNNFAGTGQLVQMNHWYWGAFTNDSVTNRTGYSFQHGCTDGTFKESFVVNPAYIEHRLMTQFGPVDFLNARTPESVNATLPAWVYINMFGAATTDIPLMIRGVVSQTSNMTEWRKSDSTLLSYIDVSGNHGIPHIIGTTGTPGIAAGTGAGTSPTISISGTDLGGYVTVTPGSSPATSSTVVTITFNVAYGSAPKCIVLTPANSATSLLTGATNVFVNQASIGTTTFTLTSGTSALTQSTTYQWFYHVIQ